MVSPGGVGFLLTSLLTIGGGVGSLNLSTFLLGGETLQSLPHGGGGGGGDGGGHPQDIFVYVFVLRYLLSNFVFC
jgi:hypothetical protein